MTSPTHKNDKKAAGASASKPGAESAMAATAVDPTVSQLGEELAALADETILGLKEAGVRTSLQNAKALASRVYAVYSAPSSDGALVREQQDLSEAGMTASRALDLVQAAKIVLQAALDKESKEKAARAAVAQLNAQNQALEKLHSSDVSRLRGQFGNTSTSLKAYGIQPLGGGRRGGTTKTTDTAKKA